MLFKMLEKPEFRKLVEIILESNEIIGPKQIAIDKDGKPVHHYLPVSSFDELDERLRRAVVPREGDLRHGHRGLRGQRDGAPRGAAREVLDHRYGTS